MGKVVEYTSYPEAYQDLGARPGRLCRQHGSSNLQTMVAEEARRPLSSGQAVSGKSFRPGAVAKGNSELLEFLNGFIAKGKGKRPNLPRLQKKWFGEGLPESAGYRSSLNSNLPASDDRSMSAGDVLGPPSGCRGDSDAVADRHPDRSADRTSGLAVLRWANVPVQSRVIVTVYVKHSCAPDAASSRCCFAVLRASQYRDRESARSRPPSSRWS